MGITSSGVGLAALLLAHGYNCVETIKFARKH